MSPAPFQLCPCSRGRRGSVLIMALWALFLLSAAVFAWLQFIDQGITVTSQHNNGLQARAMAHSGVMVALSVDVTQLTPILHQQFSSTLGYQVQLLGAGGRIDLNWVFANASSPDPARLDVFHRYLALRGLTFEQRARLTDCIQDWLTPGNVQRLNGAKESANYHPPGRGFFVNLDELRLVQGSKPLVSKPGWTDDLAVLPPASNSTGIDLQAAPIRVLESIPNVAPDAAARFVHYRRGPDNIDGTSDDYIFKTTDDALSYLGLNQLQRTTVAPLAYIQYPATFVRIRSTGQCGDFIRVVEVVAKKQAFDPIILSWKEL